MDRLRAEADAIMVGGRTLLENDPRLTVKSDQLRQECLQRGLNANPNKVSVVTMANLRPESRFLNLGPATVIIITTSQTDLGRIDFLRQQGAQVYVVGEHQVDLWLAMQELAEVGIRQLLVEGGGILIESLLRLKLADEINIFMAPLIFGGASAPTFVNGRD